MIRTWEQSDEYEVIGELHDPNADYSFHTVLVLQDRVTKKFYVGVDSGCSCPSPFEDHTYPTDFDEIRHTTDFRKYVRDVGNKWDKADVEVLCKLLPKPEAHRRQFSLEE